MRNRSSAASGKTAAAGKSKVPLTASPRVLKSTAILTSPAGWASALSQCPSAVPRSRQGLRRTLRTPARAGPQGNEFFASDPAPTKVRADAAHPTAGRSQWQVAEPLTGVRSIEPIAAALATRPKQLRMVISINGKMARGGFWQRAVVTHVSTRSIAFAGAVALAAVLAHCTARPPASPRLVAVPPAPAECGGVRRSPSATVLQYMDALPSAKRSWWPATGRTGHVRFPVEGAEDRCAASSGTPGLCLIAFPVAPKLSTPSRVSQSALDRMSAQRIPDSAGEQWTQPTRMAQHLEQSGVRRAVLVPAAAGDQTAVRAESAHIFDMAVHEGFHVNVQAPAWRERIGAS